MCQEDPSETRVFIVTVIAIPNEGSASSRTATVPFSPDGETMYSELEEATKNLITPLPHNGFLEIEVLSFCSKCGGSTFKPLAALVNLKELFEKIEKEETIRNLLGEKITREIMEKFLAAEISTMLSEMTEFGYRAPEFQFMQQDPGIEQ